VTRVRPPSYLIVGGSRPVVVARLDLERMPSSFVLAAAWTNPSPHLSPLAGVWHRRVAGHSPVGDSIEAMVELCSDGQPIVFPSAGSAPVCF
jgi:hypothetical protein